MARYSLRYNAIDVGLGPGELIAGRDEDCGLVLDDGLVSRRHARFSITETGLQVQDLGSRNGVHLNGTRIEAPAPLKHGDRVRIGAQEVVVMVGDARRRRSARPGTSELVQCASCNQVATASSSTCPSCGKPLHPAAAFDAGAAASTAPSGSGPASTGGPSFSVVSGLADKALGLKRHEEAERILGSTLTAVLSEASNEAGTLSEQTVAEAVEYAMRLAEASGRGAWLDYVFQLHGALARMMTSEVVDRLYELTETVRQANPRQVREYVDQLKTGAGELGASDRFLLQRLEGLQRRLASG